MAVLRGTGLAARPVMLRSKAHGQHARVLRSKHALGTHVPEQGTAVAHACSGAASVPDAVPEQRFLELSNGKAPGRDWRHDLAVTCPMCTAAPVGRLPGAQVPPQRTLCLFCFPHWQ